MRVLLFAHLKDVAGKSELPVRLDAPALVDTVWEKILAAAPALAAHRQSTRLARNGEYATAETRFTDTDEVALIPPVSGG